MPAPRASTCPAGSSSAPTTIRSIASLPTSASSSPPRPGGEPLKELVFGRRAPLADLSGLIDRVRLLCTLYDPASQRYRFDYSIFIGMIVGVGSLAAVGFILVRGWLRTRRPT